MGVSQLISSLLVDRRRNRSRRLADHDHGRAQQTSVELITLLEHLEHAVRLDVGAFLHGHRLVLLGIERFAVRVDSFEIEALEGVLEHLQGQLDAFAHRTNAFVVRAGQFQATLQAVDDRQKVARELLQGELVGLFHVLLGAAAHVLQVCRGTQSLILGGSDLLFEQLYARDQILATRFGVGFDVRILFVQLLLISHEISPLNVVGELDSRICRPIWGRKQRLQGRLNINVAKT